MAAGLTSIRERFSFCSFNLVKPKLEKAIQKGQQWWLSPGSFLHSKAKRKNSPKSQVDLLGVYFLLTFVAPRMKEVIFFLSAGPTREENKTVSPNSPLSRNWYSKIKIS